MVSNKLMQIAIEQQQQTKASKLRYNAAFKLFARNFRRIISLVQREQGLSLSIKEIINNVGYLDKEQEDVFFELISNAKNIIIDMASKTEDSRRASSSPYSLTTWKVLCIGWLSILRAVK